MAIISKYAVALLACSVFASTHGFAPATPSQLALSNKSASATTSTQLYIIGPMIRKMREEKEAKNMPMANPDEAKVEAPGLRVGVNAWKWPPVWPYDSNFFKRKSEMTGKDNANPMMNMMNPMEALEKKDVADVDENLFNSLKWWEENKEVTTDLDERVVAKISSHYSFYLRDGMSVLELGAAENSYLPEGLKLNKHVGVGAVKSQMEANPSITESYIVDLNDVVEDEGVKSEELADLGRDTFDAVIMANTIDFLINPREVFKSSWRALKPGGIMIVPFLAKDAYADKFDEAFTKQWRDMTDDQHMWVGGSFFQFSAGEGWEGLKGFDISPEDAKQLGAEESVLDKLKQTDKDLPPGAYVVQARKNFEAEEVDESDLEGYIKSKMWMLPTLEDRDKKLVVPRLARAYEALDTQEEKERMLGHFDSLPKIYASLIKMDQFAFTFSMQAQLAADLVGDPDFTGSDIQINNMKMGLGLRKPSADFWAPVGKLTAAMQPEEKVNLLAYIVPRFGSDDPTQQEALSAFVSGLEPTFEVIRSKCPNMKESDVQLVGSELLASEVLVPGRSNREEFALWLGSLTDVDLEFILAKRNSFKEDATKELEAFQKERADEEQAITDRRTQIQEQVAYARENRTTIFNPRTGKIEQVEPPKKGILGTGIELPFGN